MGGYQAGFVMDIAAQGPNGGEGNSVPVANSIATLSANSGILDGIVINPGAGQQITDCDLHIWVEGFRDNIVVSGTNFFIFRWQQPHNLRAWRNGWNISTTGGAGENLSIFGGVTLIAPMAELQAVRLPAAPTDLPSAGLMRSSKLISTVTVLIITTR